MARGRRRPPSGSPGASAERSSAEPGSPRSAPARPRRRSRCHTDWLGAGKQSTPRPFPGGGQDGPHWRLSDLRNVRSRLSRWDGGGAGCSTERSPHRGPPHRGPPRLTVTSRESPPPTGCPRQEGLPSSLSQGCQARGPVRGTVPGCPRGSCKMPTLVFLGDPLGALLTGGPRLALGWPSDGQDGQKAPSPTCKHSRH